jgi:D-alanyl-D-alanine carboxypeptidase (penicillin-binding protein 5/6)
MARTVPCAVVDIMIPRSFSVFLIRTVRTHLNAMKYFTRTVFPVLIFFVVFPIHATHAGRAKIQSVAEDPYVSALLLNAQTGETLFEKNADTQVYPASVLKLMDLLVILDRVREGTLALDDMVQITVEAYKMGGSQVYLDPKEQFSVDDLLYALMVQSANDAAVALATHVAGSKEGFVDLMNAKARELGMKDTRFHSVHGLPPSTGQQVDVTTARDFGKLCLKLTGYPEVFTYTGTRVRDFRNGEFVMRNHNHLLEKVEGCDGFKTGYFKAAGFSIAATAARDGKRVIALVMGSRDRKVRDAKATELLAKGFAMIPASAKSVAAPPSLSRGQQRPAGLPAADIPESGINTEKPAPESGTGIIIICLGIVALVALAFAAFRRWKKNSVKNKYRRRF